MCFIACFILYLWQTNKTVVEGLSVCHAAGVGRLQKERERRGMTGLGRLELSRRILWEFVASLFLLIHFCFV